MPKTFNVDQLRINDFLLTGNAAGELWYADNKLANGESAVPLTRTITAGVGLKHSDDTDTKSLAADITIDLEYDSSTFGIDGSNEELYILNQGIKPAHIHVDIAGAGLTGGGGAGLAVNPDDSSIEINSDEVRVKASGITNTMLAGSISDDKLSTVTTAGKVQGGAVTYDDSTIGTGSSAELIVKTNGITATQLNSSVAGNGLQLGGGGIDIVPATSSGIAVSANEIGVALLGVTNGMLAGSIENDKLLTIADSDKVQGQAVQHDSSLGVSALKLGIADQGVNEDHITGSMLSDGLAGGNGTKLTVDPGSGIVVNSNGVNIGETGILTSMIKDGQVTDAKLAPGTITAASTALVGGSGMVLNTNTFDIGQGDGISVAADAVSVDASVVRTGATQTLGGTYTFTNEVDFRTGIVVRGDLTVEGQTLLVDSQTVNIGDNIIVLNADFNGSAAQAKDAGIEVERGTQTNNAYLLFDDETSDVWKLGTAPADSADPSTGLYQIHTQEFARSYSVEVVSGVDHHHLAFGHTFSSLPNVTVSLQHTGEYGVNNPDLLGAMVTGLYTTGVHVAFTADTPNSGYYLNVHASVI